jgi:hypothetical protein
VGGCVGEVEVRSSGELPRRKTTSTVVVNGGSDEVKANCGREAKGEEMGVFYRRVDDFSENVEEWRPPAFWRSFYVSFFFFLPTKV